MTKIAFQPAGDPMSEENLEKSLYSPVILSEVEALSGTQLARELALTYPGDMARVGGVKRGKRDEQLREWEKLERGDVVLFASGDEVFLSGTITHTIQSKELARELWSEDDKGVTPECIYFIDEMNKQRIPRETINRLCGHEPDMPWDSFTVESERASANVLYAFDLESQVYFPLVPEDEYKRIVQSFNPTEPVDASRRALMRKEEGFLRNQLFRGRAMAECAICGRTYPTQFLVAAHVKAWAECSTEDRLDFENVAIPLCKLGCLELYRRNYVTVIDERVAVTTAKVDSADLRAFLTRIKGRVCTWWRGSEAYFEWHTEHGSFY